MLNVYLNDNVTDIYFRFIRFALGVYEGREFVDGSALKDFDWTAFYEFAQKQTLTGVVFDGVQRVSKPVAPRLDLLMQWFAVSRKIGQRNSVLNGATVALYERVKAAGCSCCILKGQANAALYPNPAARIPGDVDVWVNAGREVIRSLASALAKADNGQVEEESFNHIGLSLNGIAVELHYTPGFMANFVYNRRLQRWLKTNVDGQCRNRVDLPDDVGEVAAPTLAFNAVYQLYHLYHHYFYEGVGLRQVVDYYFVITMLNVELKIGDHRVCQSEMLNFLQNELKHLGLWKFAGAVMYVLHRVMALAEAKMIAPMDVKRGRMLLEDILNGGNFGHYDERYAFGHGAVGHNFRRLWRDLRLVRYYPAEAFSEPVFRVWHFLWRKSNKSFSEQKGA